MDSNERLHEERHVAVMAAIGGISERLDTLNGRTRDSELNIAVLSDRSGRINAVAISALGAVLASIIYYFFRR